MTASGNRGTRVRSVRRALEVVVAGATLAMAACDSGPAGPGTLVARAEASALGAVVLEVEGPGVTGFAGRGSTRVYSAPVAGRPGVHRVVLLASDGGELGFSIDVDDLGMDGPFVRVVSAATTDNTLLPAPRVDVFEER